MTEHEGRRGTGRRRLRRIVMVLIAAVIVEYLVLPQIAGARKAVHTLGKVEPGWLVAGVLLEAAAIASYAELTRTLLPLGRRPARTTLVRITMSTLGLSHVVPGGAAVGTSMSYRLLTTSGVQGPDAGFAIATEGLGSAVVLNVLLWVGLIVSIPIRGFNPLYGTAAVLGALLLALVGGAVAALTKGEERLATVVCAIADRVPFLDGTDVSSVLHRVAVRLRGLVAEPRLLGRAVLWAALNWILDMASLWVFLAAFGHRVGPDGLVISYGVANVLAAIPVTPGGLGVVETVLTATLVGFGTPRAVALLGVVSYRLVNFWLPIPLGVLSYLSLRVDDDVARRARELRKVAEEAEEEAPRARDWARQRGLKFRRP
jgi:putative heme transporter